MNLSDNIKQIRKEHNLSQEALAEQLGVSRQSVSKWESGQAYPEMDKVIQICNMFNISMDELMNENIKTVKETKESVSNSNKLVEDFLSFINKSIDLFTSFSFKDKIKCLIEQILIVFIFSIIALILGEVLGSIIHNMISFADGNVVYAILKMLSSIYALISIIIIFIIWIHLFKIRYLDYYEIVHSSNSEETDKVESEETNSSDKETINITKPKTEIKKEPKIIIRDEKSSSYSFFSFLIQIILFFVKGFLFFIAIGIAFVLMSLGIMLALTFLFKLNSFFFIGSFISIISGAIICLIFLKMIYDFIFNRKSRKGLMGILLGVCILTGGLGIGLFSLDCLKIDYYEADSENNGITEEFSIDMDPTLVLQFDYTYNRTVEYIPSDNNDIIIQYTHNKLIGYYMGTHITNYRDKKFTITNIYTSGNDAYIFKYIRDVIEDIKDYKICNPYINTVKVYTTQENIDTLNKNYKDYITRESYATYSYEYYDE